VVNGRHSAEGGPKEHERRRIILTRRVDVLTPDPDNPNAILWNPATAPFDEAWARLGIEGGVAAVVGGTDTFGLFLTIGYDVFYLTKTEASVPRGRPVFAGVGTTTTAEEVMRKVGLVHKDTRMLDASVNCRVEEWMKG
jgi:dihydrofolate reductase